MWIEESRTMKSIVNSYRLASSFFAFMRRKNK